MKNLYIASCDKSGGIYHYIISEDKCEFKEKIPLDRPMYLTIQDKKMYVVLREMFSNGDSGMCMYDIDENFKLKNQSEIISTKGRVACHICVNNDAVYATNYISGNVIRFPDNVVFHSGKGVNITRQEAPHTHYVGITPDNRYVCVTDLGLDKIFFYDKELNLNFAIDVLAGYGARHIAFSDDGQYLYCVNEIISSVTVFKYDGANTYMLKTYSTLPNDFMGHNQAAAIRVYKNRVYVSNRGHDSIAVFDIDGENLEFFGFIPTGREPRDFNIIDDVIICCNMNDDNVTFYSLTGKEFDCKLSIKSPLCVVGI